MWKINHERCGLLFGPAAAILQIAHPRIAQGVAEHSNFESDSVGRLRRTLASTNRIAFGTAKQAEETRERLRGVHSQVRGKAATGVEGPANYSAFEPDLLLWVLATLVLAALHGYELVHGKLPTNRKEVFYADMRRFGSYFGLGEDVGPTDFLAFESYYHDMLSNDLLGSHPLCSKLAQSIVYPRDSIQTRALGHGLSFLPIETLPAKLLPKLGLRSSSFSRSQMRLLKTLLPSLYPKLPRSLRLYPEALERLKFESSTPGFRTSHPNQ